MRKVISRAWRIPATGFCFATFGIGGLLLSVIIFGAQRLIYRDERLRKAKARRTVHYAFKFFIGLMRCVGIARFHVYPKSELTDLQGHLVLANHPSLIDIVVLISAIPNADCVVKASLLRNPFMRGVIKGTGYISNSDPESLLDDCETSLKQGNNLIIFPEGTRTTPSEAMRFRRGAANIAIRCNAPVLPLLIRVRPTTLTKSEMWYQVPERRFQFEVFATRKNLECKVAGQSLAKQSRIYTRTLQAFFEQELQAL
ncbi:lysophospholipid acyltransferase family protein [Lacimicrobium sp. SS2-24]|uniref:lysophospholipid acyltransferase family protein n=1 Tax=Lacimicrobium sp. SS2-24 TaxID=2005569 RepID=UPI000B4AEC7F|nr:lysophospholipid acyltransferase family protein [Lacimicrobium sp. SS2-24]